MVSIDCGIERSKKEAAIEAIAEQIRRLAEGDYDDSVLQAARLSVTDALQASVDSMYSIEGHTLTRFLYGITRSIEEEIAAMNAVTREQIAEAAGRLQLDTVYCLTGGGSGDAEESDEEEYEGEDEA